MFFFHSVEGQPTEPCVCKGARGGARGVVYRVYRFGDGHVARNVVVTIARRRIVVDGPCAGNLNLNLRRL